MKRRKSIILAAMMVSLFGMAQVAFSRQPTPPVSVTPVSVLSGHTGWVTALVWSPDGKLLASSSGDYTADDHTVRLWDVDGKSLAVVDNGDRTYSLSWSPDGMLLASGTEDGSMNLLNSNGATTRTLEGENGVVYSLDWSPDGGILAAGVSGGPSTNQVQLWSEDGQLLRTLPTKYSGGKFYNIRWSPDGQYLVGGAIDYTLWRADGTVVFVHDRCEHCTPAWALAWSPDSSMWAIGDENGTVYVYSIAGDLVARLQGDINVDALAWSPDGQILAGGNSLWYWDGVTFERRGGSFNGRTDVEWSPDSQLLAASFGNTQQVRLVNRQGNLVALLEHQADRLAWSPDGRILATGSSDGTIRLWNVSGMMSK